MPNEACWMQKGLANPCIGHLTKKYIIHIHTEVNLTLREEIV